MRAESQFSGLRRPYFPRMRGFLKRCRVCAMRIRIQHSGTRKFLRDADGWADRTEEARVFTSSIEAFRHCAQHGLAGVQIVVERDAPRRPVMIPIEINPSNGSLTTGFPVPVGK
jgi:hypothetical protein